MKHKEIWRLNFKTEQSVLKEIINNANSKLLAEIFNK